MNIMNDINLRFTSGNEIPITSIQLTSEQWFKVIVEFQNLKADLYSDGYSDGYDYGYSDGYRDSKGEI